MKLINGTIPALALCLCAITAARGQEADIAFELIRLPGGYTGNSIESIVQDTAGFMWFGSWAGLHRYDGYRTITFVHDPADDESITEGAVSALHVDRAGTLWVGTRGGGLDRYDPATESFAHFKHDPRDDLSLSNDDVHAILEDSRGDLWIGTAAGLNRFDSAMGTFTRFMHSEHDSTSISDHHINALYEDRLGTLWIGTGGPHATLAEGGLNRFEASTSTFSRYYANPEVSTRLLDPRVTAILEDSRGNFWIGTVGDGLHSMDRRTGVFTRYGHDTRHPNRLSAPVIAGSPQSPRVMFIYEDRRGMLWISSFGGGLNRYDPNTGRVSHFRSNLQETRSLIENYPAAIYESRDGTMWIGVVCAGVNKVVPAVEQFTTYDLNDNVTAIHEDSEGILWLGIDGRGLLSFNRATGEMATYRRDYGSATSLVNNVVYAIHESNDGYLWIGTADGLCRFDRENETFHWYRHRPNDPSSLSENGIISILEDRAGMLWVGTWLSGLNRFDPRTGRVRRYNWSGNDPTSLSSNLVLTLYETRDGILWVGTGGGGLSRYDRTSDEFTRYIHDPNDPESLSDNTVTSILETEEGFLWIGTAGGGLSRFDRAAESFHRYSDRLDLSDENIQSVLDDDDGNIWIRTEHGLTVFDPRAQIFRKFWIQPGQASRAYRFLYPFGAHHKGPRGEKFVSSGDGFVSFFPREVVVGANRIPPQVAFTDFRYFDHRVLGGSGSRLRGSVTSADKVILRHDQDVFNVSFAALHYSDPGQNRYAYTLEGYDEGWRDVGTTRTADYYRVPPGEYVFRVKAANASGFWNEEGRSISIRILPPWWATWTFRIGLISILLALAYSTYRVRLRKIRDRNRYLEEVIAERTAEVEQQARQLVEMDASKSRFFANISHEFRTPLTLLLGPIRDALAGVEGIDRLRRQLPIMERNAERLLQLVNQLLDLSKLEAGSMIFEPTEHDLRQFVREVVRSQAPRAERDGISLQFVAPDHELVANVDPDKVEKIVSNLLSNAFKFTPPAGKIRVVMEASTDDNGSWVRIVVKDTGQGIPADEIQRIFDRFYQADATRRERRDGTGIGLALAKELVELHGGSIFANSEVGFGTTITVSLPAHGASTGPLLLEELVVHHSEEIADGMSQGDGQAADHHYASVVDATNHSEWENGRAASKPTILLVDDNADVRQYLSDVLNGAYHVLEASNGLAGLELVRSTPVDLVVCDVMMSEMDGYAFCAALRRDSELNHIPVILLTAKASEDSRLEGLQVGADDYLSKPFSRDELLARIENLMALRGLLRRRFSGEVSIHPRAVCVPSADAAFLEVVRNKIEERMGDPKFGVEWLADEVGVSSRHLQRKIHTLTGYSVAAYLRTVRLDRAAQLLQQNAGNVSEIAFRVGFNNPEYFSRLFRTAFGEKPSEYRSRSLR